MIWLLLLATRSRLVQKGYFSSLQQSQRSLKLKLHEGVITYVTFFNEK